jgi:hypothetical protein
LVTNPIPVDIGVAVAVAIAVREREITYPRLCGIHIIITGPGDIATHARKVTCSGIRSGCIEVTSPWILATNHFECVANAIVVFISIHHRSSAILSPTAGVASRGVNASLDCRNGGLGVVVASLNYGTTCTSQKLAGSVVFSCSRIEIAGPFLGAA